MDEPRIIYPGTWRDIQSSLSWLKSFNKFMRRSQLPRMAGKEIIIATDSSGQHRQSPFEVLGVVMADLDTSLRWEALRQEWRKTIVKDSRRMSFKKLSEPIRRRALVPFLSAANNINGLCLCVAMNKAIKSLVTAPIVFDNLKQAGILKASWTFEGFERMSRTAHFISVLIAGLNSTGQNITWISDEDEMFESLEKSTDTLRILTTFSSMYVKWTTGRLAVGTTKLDEGDRFEEDLTAIADLTAGSFNESLGKLHAETGGRVTGPIAPTLDNKLAEKTDLLVSWFADNTHPLKRISFIFDQRQDGKMGIGLIWSEAGPPLGTSE